MVRDDLAGDAFDDAHDAVPAVVDELALVTAPRDLAKAVVDVPAVLRSIEFERAAVGVVAPSLERVGAAVLEAANDSLRVDRCEIRVLVVAELVTRSA